ncbi:hypothetical protein QAD02_006753 [Eretmocerus hayati]|uniref:Uncharacterized protein n=1 Tax=Eretmocerus hayati TaxID=131215 RepID=A0ACC2N235_9HYME|nr:hypothetical protein QAD02_006753 [Eretmocerus hayati]
MTDQSTDLIVKLIGKRLCINGFLFIKSHTHNNNETHWVCRRYPTNSCKARAVTLNSASNAKITLLDTLEQLHHNHLPSKKDVDEAELAAEFEKAEDCKSRVIGQICSSSQMYNKIALCATLETEKEMEVDEFFVEPEWKEPIQSVAGRVNCDVGLEAYTQSPNPPKVVGSKLFINGFVYTRCYCYGIEVPKTYWQCRMCKPGSCPATAISSNPDLSQALIVYRGPNESEHSHPPISAELQRAQETEEAAKCHPEKSQSKLVSTAQSDVKSIRAIAHSDSNGNHVDLRLIGKRLFIDGYIYIKQKNGPKVCWICKRSRSTGCNAKAHTSDPRPGTNLILHSVSVHNHPPSELEVEEAELIAKLDLNRAKHENSGVTQIPGWPTKNDAQTSIKHIGRHPNSKIKSATISSSNQPTSSQLKEGTCMPPTTASDDMESPRLIGSRLCIKGYTYLARNYSDNSIYWNCRRYRYQGRECPATAKTSNYRAGRNLIVYKGLKMSKHNHPPSSREVKEAVDIAKFEQKNEKKIQSLLTAESHSSLKSGTLNLQAKRSHSSNLVSEESSHRPHRSVTATTTSYRDDEQQTLSQLKRMGLLTDEGFYREFLTKFLKNPVFDRESVIDALQVIYKSRWSCRLAVEKVIKNRKKVERDLETLRRDPNAAVTAFNNDSPITFYNEEIQTQVDEEQHTENDDPVDLMSDNPTSVLNENAIKSTTVGKTGEAFVGSCIARTEVSTPLTQSSEPQEVKTMASSSTLADVPTTNASSSAPATSPSNQDDKIDLKIKREIILVDLTDDPDPKTVKQESTTGEKASQLDQAGTATIPQGNPPPLAQNLDFHGETSAFAPYGNFYPNQFAMPPGMLHPFYHPAMYPYYGMENPNGSNMANNMQVPWRYNAPNLYNAPNIWNDAAANTQQLFAQFQPHQ